MMNNDSGRSTSVWMKTAVIANTVALDKNISADVVVIGAGMAGLSTAYMLCKAGKSVVVIDDGPIGGGESARTTAHLSSALDDSFTHLSTIHGKRGAQMAAMSHQTAIDTIENIIRTEQIDCDFARVNGYLFSHKCNGDKALDKELKAAHEAGLTLAVKIDRAPLPDFDTGSCILFPRQGQFHILKYLDGLTKAIQAHGGLIYTLTKATIIVSGNQPTVTTATGHTIKAASIVIATNSPIFPQIKLHTKQAPYRTYVIGARIPKGYVPDALYWDTADPYHYVRIQAMHTDIAPVTDYDLLIIGGEDHKTGQEHNTHDCFTRLEKWAWERFPKIMGFEFQWSGQVMEPVDSLAFLGKVPGEENIYVITGDSGHGMTHSTLGGMIITDLIMGRANVYAQLYDPARITLKAAWEFVKENLNVGAQYLEYLAAGDVQSIAEIPFHSGAVVQSGLKKLAVYKAPDGVLHTCSAVCTHLACVVEWNDTEKTWDCPCHGSRFDAYGKVINGPAISDLEPITHKAEKL